MMLLTIFARFVCATRKNLVAVVETVAMFLPLTAALAAEGPDQVVFPQEEWERITPQQVGLNVEKLDELLAGCNIRGGGWGGKEPGGDQWGAVLTRGGYLVQTWGNPEAKYQSASLGKCLTRALFGLTVEAGLIDPDEPVWKTWTGRDQLSHPHKLLDAQWLRGHAGLDIHVVAGDPETMVSIAKINTQGFPLGREVGTRGRFSFPREWIADPVKLAREAALPQYEVKVEKNVRIPMRDGVTLAADLYRPDAAGKFPALMTLVYYPTGGQDAERFARYGYVGVVVNSRGRNGSEGEWDPYVNEPRDGYDAQQWIGGQAWCNGRIGMFGQSYNAFTQIMPAPLASPYLTCLLPIEGQQTNFGHLYNDGVPQLNVIFTFGLYATGSTRTGPHIPIGPHYLQLPLASAADKADHPQAQRIKTWLEHSRYDDYWKSYGVKEKYSRIRVPAWFVSGWYDNLVHENWRNFRGFRDEGGSEACRQGTRIRVGGAIHGGNTPPFEDRLRWYDHWLKGLETGVDKLPPIEIFVMGANRWRYEYEWPPARAQSTRYYLHSQGRANSVRGDGRLGPEPPPADAPPNGFVYDPENPVYTLGGQMSTHRDLWGPKDRQSVQQREDVLVYTTGPIKQDLEVTGPIELKLYAASDAVDTDFTATLTDVHPDGQAIHICEGIQRASFRESLENPTPIEPGKIYVFTISLWETSMVFKAGHRIRLEISSSNFPRYARNLNTGLPVGTSDQMNKARQTIYHDATRPSHLVLPVMP